MVEGVGGAVHQAAAVGDGNAAPMAQQFDVLFPRRFPQGPRVREIFLGDFAFLIVPAGAHRVFADVRGERLVAGEEFVHLHHVVGERFGRGVDRGQAAADHHYRQAQLHVGHRIFLGRAGQLQRHEEVGGRAHAAREAVRDVEHRRLARADAKRDMVEAHLHRVLERQRAAEAYAAEHREFAAALE